MLRDEDGMAMFVLRIVMTQMMVLDYVKKIWKNRMLAMISKQWDAIHGD